MTAHAVDKRLQQRAFRAIPEWRRLGSCAFWATWGVFLFALYVRNVFQGNLEFFHQTDFSLYFRCVRDVDFCRWSNPAAFDAIALAPTMNLELARFAHFLGFDHLNEIHGVTLMAATVALNTILVTSATYLTARGLGLARPWAILATILLAVSPVLHNFGRMLSIRSLLVTPYLSMLSGSLCLFVIGLFLRGHRRTAAVVTGLGANLHTVVVPFAGLAILASELAAAARAGEARVKLKDILKLVTIMAAGASPAVFKLLNTIVSGEFSFAGGFDPELLFTYSRMRSGNPFPISDGLHYVGGHIAVLACSIVMALALTPKEAGEGVRRLRDVAILSLVTYLIQIVFTEVIESPLVLGIVFHRLAPVAYLAFTALLIRGVATAVEAGRLTAPALLLSYLLLSNLYGFKIFAGDDWAHVERTILYCVTAFAFAWRGGPRLRFAAMAIGAIAVGFVAYATGVKQLLDAKTPWSEITTRALVESIASAYAIPIDRLTLLLLIVLGAAAISLWSVRRPSMPRLSSAVASALISIFLLGHIAAGRTYAALGDLRHLPPHESNPDAGLIELIERHTDPSEVLFVAFQTDLFGIRRQYIDWKHDWYVLYGRRWLSSIVDKIAVLSVNFRRDSEMYNRCPLPDRLFIRRCHVQRSDALSLVHNNQLWAQRIPDMRYRENALRKVVLRADEKFDCGAIRCEVVAKTDKHQIIAISM
jgi:hypothetical protein